MLPPEVIRPLLAGARWSVAIEDVTTGATILSHQPDLLLRTASVGKVFLMIELAARVVAGDLTLEQSVSRSGSDPIADSGLWHTMLSEELPVGDAIRLVGAVSDNLATNVLLDLVGLDAVRARAAQVAPGGSALHDYVRTERLPGMPHTLSEGCAGDWVSICARLERSELVGPDQDALVRDWLGSGVDYSMVISALDLDPLVHTDATDEIPVWNKTGTVGGVRADIGVVRGPARTIAYAALCNWDPAEAGVSEVLASMRDIGRQIGSLL